jgi:thiol-disulfide isomerase/thioredoxin
MGGMLRLLGVIPLLLAACTRSVATAEVKSFGLVAYQGEAVLGTGETTFPRVFEQGKPVILNFWAGQCPPCRAEMPAFQRVADEFEGKVQFIGVDIGVFTGLGSHADARQLLTELGSPNARCQGCSHGAAWSSRPSATARCWLSKHQRAARSGAWW